jgi:hypothetical protein
MRLIKLLSLCVLMSLVSARPARAWFEWLDYLSGPGPFWGGRVDVRYWCSGRETPRVEPQRKFDEARLTAMRIENDEDWKNVALLIKSANEHMYLVSPNLLDQLQSNALKIKKEQFVGFRAYLSDMARASNVSTPPQPPLDNALAQTFDAASKALKEMRGTDIAISATGIFFSLCSPDIERRWALEDGSSVMAAGGDTKYADSSWIWLITHTEAVTFRPTSRRNLDIFDLGLQAGVYMFASKGIKNNFGGFMIEPFVDVHFPSAGAGMGSAPWWSRINARIGAVNFPAGIDTQKFAATSEAEKRVLPSKFTPQVTVYYRIK